MEKEYSIIKALRNNVYKKVKELLDLKVNSVVLDALNAAANSELI
jgi:hypothetical protein